jgi:hypothetical protein
VNSQRKKRGEYKRRKGKKITLRLGASKEAFSEEGLLKTAAGV